MGTERVGMKGRLFVNGRTAIQPSPSLTESTLPGEGLAIFVSRAKIVALGSADELKLQLIGQEYETVDLEGGYVLAGLADSHMHLGMLGEKLLTLDFSEVTRKEDMLGLLRRQAELQPAGTWITGLNWDDNRLQGGAPVREELDEITRGHPIFLTRTCFHAYLANSAAFVRAGIREDAEDIPGGSFGRDSAGRLNGWVYEQASESFFAAQPAPGYEVIKERIRAAALHALSLGITAVHTEDWRSTESVADLLRIHGELQEEGIRLRTHQLLYYPSLDEIGATGLSFRDGDDWLRIGGIKLFVDGAFGGRTALLTVPYADAPGNSGMPILASDDLDRIVGTARRAGLPIAVHAIGDGGAELALSAMERHPLTKGRDRLIHASMLRGDLVDRMKRLPLAVDIQPRFVASDFPWVLERVGPGLRDYLYAWRKLVHSGLICAGGSDAPIEPLNPFLGMHAAVTRRRPDESHEGYLPEEKLTLAEALELFTTGSAMAACEEQERGRLAAGYYGDFTVIDKPLCASDPDGLLNVRTRMTVVNGEVAFRAD